MGEGSSTNRSGKVRGTVPDPKLEKQKARYLGLARKSYKEFKECHYSNATKATKYDEFFRASGVLHNYCHFADIILASLDRKSQEYKNLKKERAEVTKGLKKFGDLAAWANFKTLAYCWYLQVMCL